MHDGPQRRYRIGISGSYGGMNLGDETILSQILRELRSRVSTEFTVFSRNPEDTRRRHRVEHAVAARELSQDDAPPIWHLHSCKRRAPSANRASSS